MRFRWFSWRMTPEAAKPKPDGKSGKIGLRYHSFSGIPALKERKSAWR